MSKENILSVLLCAESPHSKVIRTIYSRKTNYNFGTFVIIKAAIYQKHQTGGSLQMSLKEEQWK